MVSYGFLFNGMYPPVWSTKTTNLDMSRTRHGAGQNAEKNIELLGDFPVKLTGTWNWPSIYDEQNDGWYTKWPFSIAMLNYQRVSYLSHVLFLRR